MVLEEAIKRDIQLTAYLNSLMNRVVYDEKGEFPPQTHGVDPKLHDIDVLPQYIPTSEKDTTLVFEARYESGNLQRAIQLMEFEYQLILRYDWGTMAYTQWFYFSVANTRKNKEYKFSIVNLMKSDSLYNAGLKPLFYSEKLAKEEGNGWFREGEDVVYYQNLMRRKNGEYYHTLNFTVKFPCTLWITQTHTTLFTSATATPTPTLASRPT